MTAPQPVLLICLTALSSLKTAFLAKIIPGSVEPLGSPQAPSKDWHVSRNCPLVKKTPPSQAATVSLPQGLSSISSCARRFPDQSTKFQRKLPLDWFFSQQWNLVQEDSFKQDCSCKEIFWASSKSDTIASFSWIRLKWKLILNALTVTATKQSPRSKPAQKACS